MPSPAVAVIPRISRDARHHIDHAGLPIDAPDDLVAPVRDGEIVVRIESQPDGIEQQRLRGGPAVADRAAVRERLDKHRRTVDLANPLVAAVGEIHAALAIDRHTW